MIEAGVVLGFNNEPVHWHLPPGRSTGHIPDTRSLWDVLWEHRATVTGFAHSHPGAGRIGPSREDITTFSAVELALGRRLQWWIINRNKYCLCVWTGPERYDYMVLDEGDTNTVFDPKWMNGLWNRSEREIEDG